MLKLYFSYVKAYGIDFNLVLYTSMLMKIDFLKSLEATGKNISQ